MGMLQGTLTRRGVVGTAPLPTPAARRQAVALTQPQAASAPAAAALVPRLDLARAQQQRCSLRGRPRAAAAAATAAAVTTTNALLANAAALQALGVFAVSCAAALFLVAAVPCMLAMAWAALRAARVLRLVEDELPDTAASLRATGMDVSDTLEALGITAGASVDADGGNGSGGSNNGNGNGAPAASPKAANGGSAARNGLPGAKLAAFLARRSRQDVAMLPALRSGLRGATTALRRARFGLGVASFAAWAARLGGAARAALGARAYRIARASAAAAAASSIDSDDDYYYYGGGGGGGSSSSYYGQQQQRRQQGGGGGASATGGGGGGSGSAGRGRR